MYRVYRGHLLVRGRGHVAGLHSVCSWLVQRAYHGHVLVHRLPRGRVRRLDRRHAAVQLVQRAAWARTAASAALVRRLCAQRAPWAPTARCPPAPQGALRVRQVPTRLSSLPSLAPVAQRVHTAMCQQRAQPPFARGARLVPIVVWLELARRSCAWHARRARTAPSASLRAPAALRARTLTSRVRLAAPDAPPARTAVWPLRLCRPFARRA
jgi:hypothetical protein